jgi:hypothetical protein
MSTAPPHGTVPRDRHGAVLRVSRFVVDRPDDERLSG